MLRKGLIVLASLAFVLTFFVWTENEIAQSFQTCIGEKTTKESSEHPNNQSNSVAVIVKKQALCSLRLVDAHNGFFASLAALAVAVFTFTLWMATVRLWKAGERQLKIIEAEFVSTHRPRLIVRHVGLAADHNLALTSILMGHDADISGGLSVVNRGGTDARIVRAAYKIYFSNTGLPIRSPLMYENPSVLLEPKTIIKGGESKVVEIWGKVDLGPPDSTSLRDIRQFEREGWIVYVMGQIRYQDDSGADHFMGFCRQRGSDGRFRAVKDDPDYEYDD